MPSIVPERREPALVDAFVALADTCVVDYDVVGALPMQLRAQTIGGLNLFTAQSGPLAGDVRGALALLQTTLNSRVIIEQAKGVLAERSGLDFTEVFALIRPQVHEKGLRLSDVARGVIEDSAMSTSHHGSQKEMTDTDPRIVWRMTGRR